MTDTPKPESPQTAQLEVANKSRALEPATDEKTAAAQVAIAKLMDERPVLLERGPPRFKSAAKVSRVNLPILPPEYLREYEAMIPNFAERSARQWEADQEHRRKMESDQQASDHKARTELIHIEWLRVNFAFLLGAAGLGVAGWLTSMGHTTSGAALGSVSVTAIVLGFLRRRADSKGGV